MDSAALFARLQLRPDAGEKEVRRAYARELKTIDQETQPEAFQELRETYERLMWLLARQRQQAAEEAAATAQAEPAAESATPQDDFADTVPAQDTVPAALAEAPQVQAPSGEALGRQVLETLIAKLNEQSFRDREEVAVFLAKCLDDPRLTNVDARQYFEWGITAILAGGWKPGHEWLLAPAMQAFGWERDRSRLLWLGRPGQIVDAAIDDLAAFDTQPEEHRQLQRDVIRDLRAGVQPGTADLLKALPVAEFVLATFPTWMYMVSQPETIAEWRTADAAIPGWRRRLAQRPLLRLRRTETAFQQAKPEPASSGNWSWIVMVAIFVSAMVRMVGGSGSSPTPPTEFIASRPPITTQVPVWTPPPQDVPPVLLRGQPLNGSAPLTLPAIPQRHVAEGRLEAIELVKGKASPHRCRDTAALVQEFAPAHERGEFGPKFDRLVLDCLVKQMGGISMAAIDVSLKRDQKRNQAEINRMIGEVRGIVPDARPARVPLEPQPQVVNPPPRPSYGLGPDPASTLFTDKNNPDRYSVPPVTLLPDPKQK